MPGGRSRLIYRATALLLTVFLASGSVYEHLGQRQDRKRLAQIGQSVDIGGRSLNIFCSGVGEPVVVFESASGIGLEWQPTQTEVAKFTRACWYDRAGMAWSDPGPFPRDSAAIAKDLHELLSRAGEHPPFVLVGFSFGGLPVRAYGGLYTHEVSGVVLVDSAQEDELVRAPNFYLAHRAPRVLWFPLDVVLRALAFVGLVRLTQPSPVPAKNSSEMSRAEIIAALRQQPKSFVAGASTGIVEPASYGQASSVSSLGNRPLIVLTAGQAPDFHDAELNRQAAAYQQVWIHEIQAKLARLSTRGQQIVVENSTHDIASQEPNVLIAAVRDIVATARTEAGKH